MEENGNIQQEKPVGKRGLIIALLALVAVLAIGFYAYSALSAQGQAARTGAPEAGEASSATGDASGAESETPKLVDYNPTVLTQDGQERTFVELADGKPLIVNFWATWCPYCVKEMGDYQELYREYGDRISFAFVDVADGQRETVEDAAMWLADNGYDLPAYFDTTYEAVYTYGAQNLPTTVVVSGDGSILDVSAGAIDLESMRETLDGLLAA